MGRVLALAALLLCFSMPAVVLAAPHDQEGGYVVQQGDTLANIAARLGVSMGALINLNGITNADLIYVGQVLTVPGSQTAPSREAVTTAQPQGEMYVIQRGDTLASIATRHGTTVAALMEANGISNENRIYAGQQLVTGDSVAAVTTTDAAPVTTADAAPVTMANAAPAWTPTGGRWIDIDLSKQLLSAYEGDTAVFSTLVSTGTAYHPTPVGEFAVQTKVDSQTMSGPDYYLPNVQYVMYFAGANAIHGTYWHNNFGQPMSHGCVNLPNPDAAWLYSWASIGTPVITHY